MKNLISLILLLGSINCFAQHDFYQHAPYEFTHADTLRGMLRPERTCFDVTFYDLNLKIDPEKRSINGYVKMVYRTLEDFKTLQVDLFQNMDILKIKHGEETLNYRREENAVFVDFPRTQKKGKQIIFKFIISAFHSRLLTLRGTVVLCGARTGREIPGSGWPAKAMERASGGQIKITFPTNPTAWALILPFLPALPAWPMVTCVQLSHKKTAIRSIGSYLTPSTITTLPSTSRITPIFQKPTLPLTAPLLTWIIMC